MARRLLVLVSCLWLAASAAQAASKGFPLLDKDGATQGYAKVSLAKGTVGIKAHLAPLPATVNTGTEEFQATIYKAYLVSSTDAAMEIPLVSLYPTSLSNVAAKATLKGDVSLLGLDKLVIVAFSEDGLMSFDVLTATLVAPAP